MDKNENKSMNENETMTFSFCVEDTEAQEMLVKEFGLSDKDFKDVNYFNGEKVRRFFSALIKSITDPKFIEEFTKKEDREVQFDAEGNLLMAKGYSATEVLEIKRAKYRL